MGRRGMREGPPDHAARVRCSLAAGLHRGACRPIPLTGTGPVDPSRTPRRPIRVHPCAVAKHPRCAVRRPLLLPAWAFLLLVALPRSGALVVVRCLGARQALRFLEKKSVQRFQASVAAAALYEGR
jgi:hypothetical protein